MVALGPESLTWRYFGDLRTSLLGMWVVAMQNMYPSLGAVVEKHSVVTSEPLERVARSMYPIMGVVYDQDRAEQTARQVRDYHRNLGAVPGWGGRRYHALNPDTFYWAHVTFFMQTMNTAEVFCGGLTESERRRLFAEHVDWYRLYGMSMRPVPVTWDDFQVYYRRMCSQVLEINKATTDVLWMRIPRPRFVPLPTKLWDALLSPFGAGHRWIATGCFDPEVRERAGLAWTAADERLLRRYAAAVRALFTLLPDVLRLHPRALAARRRADGKSAPGAPLPDAPPIFGPPKHRRGLPQHHLPDPNHPPLLVVLAPQLLSAALLAAAGGCAALGKVLALRLTILRKNTQEPTVALDGPFVLIA
jgi:uncharacterized protein (DUF2236 family)